MTSHDHLHGSGLPGTVRGRPWAVTMIGRMLVVETLLLILLGSCHLVTGNTADSLPSAFPWALTRLSIGYSPPLVAIYWVLGVWAAFASVLFIRTANAAWFTALSLQGVILAVMIIRYYTVKPAYGYILMIYAAWLVVYLHYSEVEAFFHAPVQAPERTVS